MDRVLVYTATYGGLLRRETLDSVYAQEFAGRYDYEVGYHNPFGEGDLRNVTAQMNLAREMALTDGYDALLTVEHDMQIPSKALQLLWDADAPVAYGVYVFRHAFRYLNTYEALPMGSRGIGESLTLHPKKLERARKTLIAEVSGVGFGCTLIRRAVLQEIEFRHRPGDMCGTDTYFAQDCVRAGIRQIARWDVPCNHWNGSRWLRPDDESALGTLDMVPVRALADVTLRIGLNSVPLRTGDEIQMPLADAKEHARAGYILIC